MVQDMNFSQDEVYGQSIVTDRVFSDFTVNDIRILDSRDSSVNVGAKNTAVIAATDKGLFRSDDRRILIVDKFPADDEDKKYIGLASRGEYVYALDEDGNLYRRDEAGNFGIWYGDRTFTGPVGIVMHQSGLYIANKAGAASGRGIWRFKALDGSAPVLEYAGTIDAFTVCSLAGDSRVVFAATGNKILYYSDDGSRVDTFSFSDDSALTAK